MTGDGAAGGRDPSSRGSGRFGAALSWSFVMEGGQQISALAVSLILAAMLGPEAYGLSAMALVYVNFLNLIQRQGIGPALIQRRDLDRSHLDAAFWMLIAGSAIVSAVSLLFASWWAALNGDPLVQYLIVALTVTLPMYALSGIQEAQLLRQQRIRSLAVRSLVSVIAGGVAGIIAALSGVGVWALVVQQIVQVTVAMLILWSASPWRPSWSFSISASRDLLSFSSGSFLTALSAFFQQRGDAVVLGIFFNPAILGLYRMAARLNEAALSLTTKPVRTLALPSLSKEQGDPRAMHQRYLQLVRISTGVAMPVMGLMAGLAVPLVLILGEEWLGAAGVIQWLSVVGAGQALIVANGPMLQAMGRPHLGALFGWVLTLTSLAAYVVVSAAIPDPDSTEAATQVAAARAIVWVVVICAIHVAVVRVAGLRLMDTLRASGTGFLAGLAAAGVSGATATWLTGEGLSPLLIVLVGGSLGALSAGGLSMISDFNRRLAARILSRSWRT